MAAHKRKEERIFLSRKRDAEDLIEEYPEKGRGKKRSASHGKEPLAMLRMPDSGKLLGDRKQTSGIGKGSRDLILDVAMKERVRRGESL